ncbi:anthranilate phosphoribosyltransferase, partial [mine drainage metagenome]
RFSIVRKKLQFRTIFNLLGPLTNPLDPDFITIGVSGGIDPMIYANSMKIQGKNGFVVSGDDGMDEISISSPTKIIEVNGGIRGINLESDKIIGRYYDQESVSGESSNELFYKTISGLSGSDEACSKFIALNTAPTLILNNISLGFKEGYELAMRSIRSGKAIKKLSELGKFQEAIVNGA